MFATCIHAENTQGIHFNPLTPVLIDGIGHILRDNNKFILEEVPKVYLKKYYVGCLTGKKNPIILVKRIGGLGDCIWTLPLIKKFALMGAEVWTLTLSKDIPLFKNNPYVVKSFGLETFNFKDIEKVDFIFDLFLSVENNLSAEYTDAFDIPFKWAFNTEAKKELIKDNIFLTDEEIGKAKEMIKGNEVLAYCIDSSNPKRTYPHIKAVIERLKSVFNGKIMLLGGSTFDYVDDMVLNLTGKMDLRTYFALISLSKAVLCSDSGNLHIASQFNIPTVSLFSTVKSTERCKYYDNVKAIDSPEPCAPCLKLGEYCGKNGQCMNAIKIDDIISAVKGCI
jgi:ADP-heptose:LPS heptosyltransferase